jgi:hypothetical protein
MSSALADGVLAIVKAATEPLFARIKALEAELVAVKAADPVPGPAGKDGENGADGKDADPEVVKALQVTLAELRGDMDALRETHQKSAAAMSEMVAALAEQALVARELPELPDVAGLVAAEVERAIARIPEPKDGAPGRDGVDGSNGADGRDGVDGKDGAPGRDGVGAAGAVIDREGALVLTLSDGTTKSLGIVVGQKGEPGRDGVDGRDGVGFQDLDETYEDDGRVLVRRFIHDGVVVREFRHNTKQLVYRGVYEVDKTYAAGDAVTWGGAVWIAKCETSAKPDDHGHVRDWQLAVKRGAEGRQGKQGESGERGPQGVRGEKGEPGRWS